MGHQNGHGFTKIIQCNGFTKIAAAAGVGVWAGAMGFTKKKKKATSTQVFLIGAGCFLSLQFLLLPPASCPCNFFSSLLLLSLSLPLPIPSPTESSLLCSSLRLAKVVLWLAKVILRLAELLLGLLLDKQLLELAGVLKHKLQLELAKLLLGGLMLAKLLLMLGRLMLGRLMLRRLLLGRGKLLSLAEPVRSPQGESFGQVLRMVPNQMGAHRVLPSKSPVAAWQETRMTGWSIMFLAVSLERVCRRDLDATAEAHVFSIHRVPIPDVVPI